MLPTNPLYTQIAAQAKGLRDPSLRWKIECLLSGLKRRKVAPTCRQFGIHRTTFYRWVHRLSQEGFDPHALHPRSRRPFDHPRRLQGRVVERILWYRRGFHYGPDRIEWYLGQEGLPVSSGGIYNVLKREGVVFRKRRDQRPNRHRLRYELDRPGQGVQLDIKYVPFPVEQKKAFVYNAIDDCSRWRFQWVYRCKGAEEACDFLQRLKKAAPFSIERIQTDNDVAFTNRFQKTPHEEPPQPHPFEALLQSYGIRHKLLPPGLKELNGKVERSHKTDDQEFYWRLPTWISFEEFQRQLLRWTFEYNHYRPHTSLKMKPPVQRLADFGIKVLLQIPGTWVSSQKPTHYQYVLEKLRAYRRSHPNDKLIHWAFKPHDPKLKSPNPSWLPGTPCAMKALSQMNQKTTGLALRNRHSLPLK